MLPREFAAGDAQVIFADWLNALESTSLEAPLRDTLPIWHQGFEDNFMRAVGPGGSPWAPRKDNLPHPLLIHLGRLIEAVRDTGNGGNISIVGWRTLTTGVDSQVVRYAPFHQEGTQRMVARPYLYAANDVQNRALQVFADGAFEILVGV